MEVFKGVVKWSDLPSEVVRPCVERVGFRGEDVLLVMNKLSPGMELKPHSHPFEQIACILTGRMRWVIGGETIEVEAGSVLRVPPDVVHGGIPIGDETVMNLDIFCPLRSDYLHLVDHQSAEFSTADSA